MGAELTFVALNEDGINENSFFVAAEFTLCLFMMVSRREFLGGDSLAVVSFELLSLSTSSLTLLRKSFHFWSSKLFPGCRARLPTRISGLLYFLASLGAWRRLSLRSILVFKFGSPAATPALITSKSVPICFCCFSLSNLGDSVIFVLFRSAVSGSSWLLALKIKFASLVVW